MFFFFNTDSGEVTTIEVPYLCDLKARADWESFGLSVPAYYGKLEGDRSVCMVSSLLGKAKYQLVQVFYSRSIRVGAHSLGKLWSLKFKTLISLTLRLFTKINQMLKEKRHRCDKFSRETEYSLVAAVTNEKTRCFAGG